MTPRTTQDMANEMGLSADLLSSLDRLTRTEQAVNRSISGMSRASILNSEQSANIEAATHSRTSGPDLGAGTRGR